MADWYSVDTWLLLKEIRQEGTLRDELVLLGVVRVGGVVLDCQDCSIYTLLDTFHGEEFQELGFKLGELVKLLSCD